MGQKAEAEASVKPKAAISSGAGPALDTGVTEDDLPREELLATFEARQSDTARLRHYVDNLVSEVFKHDEAAAM